jgi:hypothetical protein
LAQHSGSRSLGGRRLAALDMNRTKEAEPNTVPDRGRITVPRGVTGRRPRQVTMSLGVLNRLDFPDRWIARNLLERKPHAT